MVKLLLHLLERKHTTIQLFLLLLHQCVDFLYRLDLSIHIGQERDVFSVFVNTQTQHSIFWQISVLIVEHLLLWVRIYVGEPFPYGFGQKDAWNNTSESELRRNYFVGSHFLVNRSEIGFQQVIFFLGRTQRLHIIGRERARHHMNELKQSLERFVQKMVVMAFNLLCPLYIEQVEHQRCHEVHIFISHSLLIIKDLLYQSQISTGSTHILIHLHVAVQLENRLRVWSNTHI